MPLFPYAEFAEDSGAAQPQVSLIFEPQVLFYGLSLSRRRLGRYCCSITRHNKEKLLLLQGFAFFSYFQA